MTDIREEDIRAAFRALAPEVHEPDAQTRVEREVDSRCRDERTGSRRLLSLGYHRAFLRAGSLVAALVVFGILLYGGWQLLRPDPRLVITDEEAPGQEVNSSAQPETGGPWKEIEGQVVFEAGWGEELGEFGRDPDADAEVREPNALWVAADGTLFILDPVHQRVQEVLPEGTAVRQIPDPRVMDVGGPPSAPTDVAVAPDGLVFVDDTRGAGLIWVYTAQGDFAGNVQSAGEGAWSERLFASENAVFAQVRRVVVDEGEHVFATVYRYDADPLHPRSPVENLDLADDLQPLGGAWWARPTREPQWWSRETEPERGWYLDVSGPHGPFSVYLPLPDKDERSGLEVDLVDNTENEDIVVSGRLNRGGEHATRLVWVFDRSGGLLETIQLPADERLSTGDRPAVRLTPDGRLYVLNTYEDGVRVVRYDVAVDPTGLVALGDAGLSLQPDDLAHVRVESYRIEENLALGWFPLCILSPVADEAAVRTLLKAYGRLRPEPTSRFPSDLALEVTLVRQDGGEVRLYLRGQGDDMWIREIPPRSEPDNRPVEGKVGRDTSATAPQLALMLRELARQGEEPTFEALPSERPADFGFVFAYGVQARNVLDTFAARFTKDLISPHTPTATGVFDLTEEELDRVYDELGAIDILGYESVFRPDTGGVFKAPHESYHLRFRANGVWKEIYWDDAGDSTASAAVALRGVLQDVRRMIEEDARYKALPPIQGGLY
jgi:hypothetical protein